MGLSISSRSVMECCIICARIKIVNPATLQHTLYVHSVDQYDVDLRSDAKLVRIQELLRMNMNIHLQV